MAITIISGPPKTGKSALGATLRNFAISNGRGALLLDDANKDADPRVLVEKLLVAEHLPDDVPSFRKVGKDAKGKEVILSGIDALPWKKDPHVIAVDKAGRDLLNKIESVCPGFKERFGPASGISTTVEVL